MMSGRPAKRPRSDHSVVKLWEREVGLLPNRSFSNLFSASEDLIRRLGVDKKLRKHKGCVNTLSFNAAGDILLSGSDDRHVILWNWETASVKLSFDSGHRNNIFQAKFMPFSDDCSIVTSAADGQCEYVVSGSDCGRIFIWRKKDGELLRAMEADKHVVNCKESHPHMPLMCRSGIESDIKIWSSGGTEEPISPGNAKQDSVSRRFLFYDEEGDDNHVHIPNVVYLDDSDDETSDASSDDDDSEEEEDENDDDDGGGGGDSGKDIVEAGGSGMRMKMIR